MKLKDVLDKTSGFFREKGFPTARLDAELLLAHGLGMERIRLYLEFDRPLKDEETNLLRELVRRRSQGEPVAYVIGKKDFFSFTFQVGPGVLIPRPETEHLVETALDFAKKKSLSQARIVDLGCGSGCIGLSLLKNLPESRLLAVDRSPAALSFARKNAEALGVADRVTFFEGDVSAPATRDQALKASGFEGFDLLLANPPYIAPDDKDVEVNVKKYEPSEALFAGDEGLADLKAWTSTWIEKLDAGGLLACEMGSAQGPSMIRWFTDLKLEHVSVARDLAGHDRVIQGVRHG